MEAEKVGLRLLRHYSGKAKIYRFQDCGHEQKIDTSNVRNGSFECQLCSEEKFKLEADNAGLTYIKHIKAGRKLYKFNNCGHEQVISAQDVVTKRFECRECILENLKREADQVGLIFLGKAEPWKGRYRFKQCGHEKVINYKQVRTGSFLCQQCEETYRTKPSFVYLLHIRTIDFEWLKLGYARNIELRTKGYGLSQEAKVNLIGKRKFSTAIDAEVFEQKIHKAYRKYRISKAVMKKFHKNDGYNECYSIHIKYDLKVQVNGSYLAYAIRGIMRWWVGFLSER